jgi:hypothetical protein
LLAGLKATEGECGRKGSHGFELVVIGSWKRDGGGGLVGNGGRQRWLGMICKVNKAKQKEIK